MQITFNNELINCKENITIAELLEQLTQSNLGVALSVNQQVIPKGKWKFHQLNEGDQILFFQIITGG